MNDAQSIHYEDTAHKAFVSGDMSHAQYFATLSVGARIVELHNAMAQAQVENLENAKKLVSDAVADTGKLLNTPSEAPKSTETDEQPVSGTTTPDDTFTRQKAVQQLRGILNDPHLTVLELRNSLFALTKNWEFGL